MSTPLVSICCLTYNHAPFIQKCLDGFLMQKTTFPIEILIHDDASTDGTDEIIKEYTRRYPNVIFPLFEEENKYSHGYAGKMDIEFNYLRAQGNYIAYCEGDDYWTDPYKLQKQVDFMESKPDCSVCFTRTKHLNYSTGIITEDNCSEFFNDGIDKFEITKDIFFKKWYTQPLSMVFKKEKYDFEWQKKYKYYRDSHEIYHLLNQGEGWILNFFSGVYVCQEHGIHSLISEYKKSEVEFKIAKELHTSFRDYATKNNLKQIAVWHFNQSLKMQGYKTVMLLFEQPLVFAPIVVHSIISKAKNTLRKKIIGHCGLRSGRSMKKSCEDEGYDY